MAHGDNRGSDKDATKEAETSVLRTDQPSSAFHNGADEQSALDEPREPGELRERARTRAAWDLADILAELRVSKRCVADRHMHVDEATVRKLCTGEKPIGVGDLELLPELVAIKLVRRVLARRGIKL
jgi:hypothetical protein